MITGVNGRLGASVRGPVMVAPPIKKESASAVFTAARAAKGIVTATTPATHKSVCVCVYVRVCLCVCAREHVRSVSLLSAYFSAPMSKCKVMAVVVP